MADAKSPSPIISYFVREIESSLPVEEKEKLTRFSDEVAKTTHHGDFRRAWHCAEWAIQMAERSSDSHLDHLVKHLKRTSHPPKGHRLWGGVWTNGGRRQVCSRRRRRDSMDR